MSDELPDFGDREAVEAWAHAQPRDFIVLVVARIALRVLPLSKLALSPTYIRVTGDYILPAFRASSTSWFNWRSVSSIEIRNMRMHPIYSATEAAYMLKRNSIDIVNNFIPIAEVLESSGTMSLRGYGKSPKEEIISILCSFIEHASRVSQPAVSEAASDYMLRGSDVEALYCAPLWLGGVPLEVDEAWQELKRYLYDRPEERWEVWTDWYEARLRGDPPDWELEKARVLGLEDFWEKGPEAVNAEIARRMADILARRAPLAEDLVQDPETGRYEAHPRPVAKPDLLKATLDQVIEAVEDVVDEPTDGLNETSLEIRRLRRLTERYANDPQRIEMTLTTVHGMVATKIANDELPPSDGNAALLTAMEEGAQGIRATDAAVAENRRILQEQKLREITPEASAKIAEAAPALEAITQGDLQVQMREDILYLTEEMRLGPPRSTDEVAATGRDEAVRLFGRVSRMYLELRRAVPETVEKLTDSTGMKFAVFLLTLEGLVRLGLIFF